MDRRTDTELQTCPNCGSTFDLAKQYYYDSLCPDCKDERETWPICPACQERYDPSTESHAKSVPIRGGGYEYLLFCSETCKEDFGHHQ